MSEKDGGPAFPNGPGSKVATNGMDLRDYYASQALIGLIGCWEEARSMTPADVASEVYIYADAMLAERSKP